MKKSYVIWFTGLSGSGKSTLCLKLAKILQEKKFSTEIIDGDEFRKKVHPNLRFTPEEIKLNNKKVIDYCLKRLGKTDFLLVPVIAPFKSTRSTAKKLFGKSYIEIYCKLSLEKAIQRDVKGLYKKALKGKIDNFIGLHKNVPYEQPEDPNILIDTEKLTVRQSINLILNYLEKNIS